MLGKVFYLINFLGFKNVLKCLFVFNLSFREYKNVMFHRTGSMTISMVISTLNRLVFILKNIHKADNDQVASLNSKLMKFRSEVLYEYERDVLHLYRSRDKQ